MCKNSEYAKKKSDTENIMMYQVDINAAMQEANLVWLRYTAFAIFIGFLISAILQVSCNGNVFNTNGSTEANADELANRIYTIAGLIGVIVSTVWYILNYAGWKSQYLHFYWAGKHVYDDDLTNELKWFQQEANLTKFGWIYGVAQVIPILCFIGFSLIFYRAFGLLFKDSFLTQDFVTVLLMSLCYFFAAISIKIISKAGGTDRTIV